MIFMCSSIIEEILIYLSDDAEDIEQIKNLLHLNKVKIPSDYELMGILSEMLKSGKIKIIYPDNIYNLNMDNIYDCWFALI